MLAAKISLALDHFYQQIPSPPQKYTSIEGEAGKRSVLGLEARPLKQPSAEASVLAETRGVSMEQFWLTKPKK